MTRNRPTPDHPYSFALGFRAPPLKWTSRSSLAVYLHTSFDANAKDGNSSEIGNILKDVWVNGCWHQDDSMKMLSSGDAEAAEEL